MQPCLVGLTVEKTTERMDAAREGNFKCGWKTRRRRKANKARFEVKSGCDLCVCVYMKDCTCMYFEFTCIYHVHPAHCCDILKTRFFSLWTPGYVALYMASAYLHISI